MVDCRVRFICLTKERSRSYVTEENEENGRQDAVRNESNYFKTDSKYHLKQGAALGDIFPGRVAKRSEPGASTCFVAVTYGADKL